MGPMLAGCKRRIRCDHIELHEKQCSWTVSGWDQDGLKKRGDTRSGPPSCSKQWAMIRTSRGSGAVVIVKHGAQGRDVAMQGRQATERAWLLWHTNFLSSRCMAHIIDVPAEEALQSLQACPDQPYGRCCCYCCCYCCDLSADDCQLPGGCCDDPKSAERSFQSSRPVSPL